MRDSISINTAENQVLKAYHMPFKFDASKVEKNVLPLIQNGFINYYSKRRQTPLFTAEKLNGKLLEVNQHYICVYIVSLL